MASRPLPASARAIAPPSRSTCDRLVMAAVLVACALFLFADVRPLPIMRWDESRNIVNALEMQRAGLGVVTTYGGHPDLWNTKPPLVIWAMTLSTDLFGVGERALRLPSLLATLGTLTVVMAFVRRVTGSLAAAVGAAAMLTLSPGFLGEHAARTADYDAPLVFFTTACATALFAVVHRRRTAALAIAAAAGGAALMAKGIAGAVPLAGVGLYAASLGRWRRLATARVAVAALLAAAPLAIWLALREAAGPGFLIATWRNDVGGRYARSLIGAAKPATFYLDQLAAGYVAGLPLILAAPFGWRMAAGARERLAIRFALCMAGAQLIVVSAAASKLSHYLLPALPFMAIAAAVGTRALARRLPPWPFAILVAGVATASVHLALAVRYREEPPRAWPGAGPYAALFAALPRGEVVVWEPAAELEGWQHYAPELDGYRLIWAERGLAVRQAPDERSIGDAPLVASCDPRRAALLRRRGRDIAHVPGCAAIRVSPRTAAPASPAPS